MQPKNQHGIANDFHRLRNVELVFTRLRESGGCVMCGDTRLAVLEFHHLDRTHKRFNVSRGLSYGSIKSLSDEMNKCIVLCSNCHGIVTAIEDGTVRVAFIEENDLNNYHRAFRSPTP
jgi:5-methylcytosine-specific restriction endonuclease McrA